MDAQGNLIKPASIRKPKAGKCKNEMKTMWERYQTDRRNIQRCQGHINQQNHNEMKKTLKVSIAIVEVQKLASAQTKTKTKYQRITKLFHLASNGPKKPSLKNETQIENKKGSHNLETRMR